MSSSAKNWPNPTEPFQESVCTASYSNNQLVRQAIRIISLHDEPSKNHRMQPLSRSTKPKAGGGEGLEGGLDIVLCIAGKPTVGRVNSIWSAQLNLEVISGIVETYVFDHLRYKSHIVRQFAILHVGSEYIA